AGIQAAEQMAVREALSHYRNALMILERPAFASRTTTLQRVRREMAELFRISGRFEKAIAILRKCIEEESLAERKADLYKSLGQALHEKGDSDKASRALELSLKMAGRTVPSGFFTTILALGWAGAEALWLLIRRRPPEEYGPERYGGYERQARTLGILTKVYFFRSRRKLVWSMAISMNLARRLN